MKIIIILMLLTIVSCSKTPGKITTKPVIPPNPSSYTFNKNWKEIRSKILEAVPPPSIISEISSDYDNYALNNPGKINAQNNYDKYMRELNIQSTESNTISFSSGISGDTAFCGEVFSKKENNNDIVLYTWGEALKSNIYFVKNEALPYRASCFHIHFDMVNDEQTKVSIKTIKPVVLNGTRCCTAHGAVSIEETVPQSSVVNYKILLLIGKILKVSDMPPLRVPK